MPLSSTTSTFAALVELWNTKSSARKLFQRPNEITDHTHGEGVGRVHRVQVLLTEVHVLQRIRFTGLAAESAAQVWVARNATHAKREV
jgi:hypothetical protein